MKYRVLMLIAGCTLAFPAKAADRETREIFKNYTECVVRQHPRDAIQVVLTDTPSGEIMRRYPSLITPDCLDAGELRIPGGEFVLFGFAEALLRRDYLHGFPEDIAQAAPLTHAPVDDTDYQPKPGKKISAKELAELQERDKQAHAVRALSIYAECVARSDPDAALKLSLSDPGSSQESSAFATLQPALSSCLEKGKTITLEKTAVRGAIALDLYRLAKAPRVKPGAATK